MDVSTQLPTLAAVRSSANEHEGEIVVYEGGSANPVDTLFHPMLPVELALGDMPRKDILASYSVNKDKWERLRTNAVFVKAVRDAKEQLAKEGASFRIKAKMQAEQLLETSWRLIHDKYTPASVKADLIKYTTKVAGLEPKEGQITGGNNLQININL
jgi:hypothetical protein